MVVSTGQTRIVTRYFTVRSHSGKPFQIDSIDMPDATMVAHQTITTNGGYHYQIQNISPSTNLNGRAIVIHTDQTNEPTVTIPIRVTEKKKSMAASR